MGHMRLSSTDAVQAPEGYRRLQRFFVPENYVEPPAGAESREQPYGFLVWLGRQILRFQGLHIVVKGAENYLVQDGAVIASNHIGYLDPFFVMVPAFLRGRRLIRFMGKAEVFDIPGFGPLLRLVGIFPSTVSPAPRHSTSASNASVKVPCWAFFRRRQSPVLSS